MLGQIRLVNPNRGYYRASICNGLVLSEKNERYEFHLNSGGFEFYPGRSFSRDEILELANYTFDPNFGVDEFGQIPANTKDPRGWVWKSISNRGENQLRSEYKPSIIDIANSCSEIISNENAQINLDRFEIWLHDWKTKKPIALAVTAETLESADWQTFSPIWRFCISSHHNSETYEFESQINSLINYLEFPKIGYFAGIYERTLDGDAIEWYRDKDGEFKSRIYEDKFPSGLLAEPWEKIRIDLEEKFLKGLDTV
ncbi:hypothetical protein LEP1GSC132_0004 [Leptospira kirschneri str. 200803703]|uniref:hypothetical protein n=1 Tax=Leptospira kirschneri TaxID=29507 RepID=UPI0002BF4C02|nr:hypothetical protein [Leptospira kirschneri]EMO66604.1 hypothetical protein LEP1GSC132_0004 [Leptospira kirschneri str. 200803703]